MPEIGTLPLISVDLNEFKLRIAVKKKIELTVLFNSPSRRFYFSLIAFVVNEMKKAGRVTHIALERHHGLLALLNDTVGGSAGSSEKRALLQRIYVKWQSALPDLEEAPLFTVLGRKKGYEEGIGRSYRVTETEKDAWANLFEYQGSHQNVRLKFAVDKIGASLDDIVIRYEGIEDAEAWERFVSSLHEKEEVRAGEGGDQGVIPPEPAKSPDESKNDQSAAPPSGEDASGWKPARGLSIPGHRNWVLESRLGTGGAGEVWLAANVNTRLKHVFKFCFEPERVRSIKREVVLLRLLKESLGDRDDIARVIDWELGSPPYYIETEYTEGGDLKAWVASQGGMDKVPLETRLELVAQVSLALNAAHGAGVLHKDIKPANILISSSGDGASPRARLTDFGIGLLADPEALKKRGITAAGLTQTLHGRGSTSTSGTPLYMAPELLEGKPPSPQSDVYSLGVLLYQMVIGDFSRALALGWEQGVKDDLLREDIAACVHGDPSSRLSDPAKLAERLRTLEARRSQRQLEQERAMREQIAVRRRRTVKRVSLYGGGIMAVVVLLSVAITAVREISLRSSQRNWARETALPEIKRLLDAEDHTAAYFLARKAERMIPDDPTLREYIEKSTTTIDIQSAPPGASVSYKSYTDKDGESIELGVTPIKAARVPVGVQRWRVRKAGYQDKEVARKIPSWGFWQGQKALMFPASWERYTLQFDLYEESRVPHGAIGVDGGRFHLDLHVYGVSFGRREFEPFFIDLTEVTNKAYKEFMDVGGYSREEFWKEEFRKEGRVIPWAEAVKGFVDRTGRPGPSTWEFGNYPEGQDDYPVSGVSWYEAAAYARFRNKSLPSIYHWFRAAFSDIEVALPLTPWIIPASNLAGTGPARVGAYPGIGSSGARDMAGNVREWCWNPKGEQRYCLGGMWSDPSYLAITEVAALPPWDRSPGNGFRCAVYPQGTSMAGDLFQEVNLGVHDQYRIPPFSQEVLGKWRSMVSYERTPLNPVVEATGESARDWRVETVSIDAAYDRERLTLHLYLPTSGTPPYKAVVYLPGVDAMYLPAFALNTSLVPWDCVPKSGRAFVVPVYSGMWERGGGSPEEFAKKLARTRVRWVQDMGRTIDYLQSRRDIDTESLAYMGLSLGANLGPQMAVLEERIRTLILLSGGLPIPAAWPKPEGLWPPHVKVPVLMLNGKHDYVLPAETHQKPLFDLLGTPTPDKRHILYVSGHAPLPRAEAIRDILEWLDRYQGPAKGKSN
jgi:serine/threonine protein kinase